MSKQSPRPTVIAGNWKMYKTIEESVSYLETLAPLVKKSQAAVLLAVPFTAIYPSSQKVKELGCAITIGAQNMNDASEGAFTGEIAARMVVEAGAQFVILGHSERRQIFHESSSFINAKLKSALAAKLQPIVCIGETLEQHENNERDEVLKSQILRTLEGLKAGDVGSIILAYEPIWAIGTGKVAKAEDAEAAHHFCREVVAKKWGKRAAKRLVIQYGGSVKPENAPQLLAQENIDGLLVGGASLSPEAFSQIIRAAEQTASLNSD